MSENELNVSSDYCIGCKLLSSAKWFELTIAERSKDDKHNDLIDKLYDGKLVTPEHLKQYELWNTSNLTNDDNNEKKHG